MKKTRTKKLNDYVMAMLYAPLLFFTAFLEQQDAKKIRTRRRRGEDDDDDTVEEWEELGWTPEGREGSGAAEHVHADGEVDGVGEVQSANDMQPIEGDRLWCEKVKKTSPNVKANKTVEEVQKLQKEVQGLKDLVEKIVEGKNNQKDGQGASEKDDQRS